MTLERDIEEAYVKWVEGQGGQCLKLRVDGVNGFPDRTTFLKGKILFFEFKRPGGKLRPMQEWFRGMIEGQNLPWFECDNLEHAITITKAITNG